MINVPNLKEILDLRQEVLLFDTQISQTLVPTIICLKHRHKFHIQLITVLEKLILDGLQEELTLQKKKE